MTTLCGGLLILTPIVTRTALLGLAIWFVLILYLSMLGGSTLEGCDAVGNQIVCAPGTLIVVFPV
jgi:hypothetical protein